MGVPQEALGRFVPGHRTNWVTELHNPKDIILGIWDGAGG
jgi:hypothetical protein